MKSTRRQFLQTTALATAAAGRTLTAGADSTSLDLGKLSAFAIANRHTISRDTPTPNFFEGMLLGNGDVGVCVVVRPDALGLHIGKNDCWDIRMSQGAEEHVLPFADLLNLWQRASDAAKQQGKPDMLFLEENVDFFREYTRKTGLSYAYPWPRPWPCGTVWLHWDPRWVHVGNQSLDPSNGRFTADIQSERPEGAFRMARLVCFVDWETGLICVGTDAPVPLSSIRYCPRLDEEDNSEHTDGSKTERTTLPRPELTVESGNAFTQFSCYQYFPALGPTENIEAPRSNKDRNFTLRARIAGEWLSDGRNETSLSFKPKASWPLRLDLRVVTPRDIALGRLESMGNAGGQSAGITIPQDYSYNVQEFDTPTHARTELQRWVNIPHDEIFRASETHWREFWSHSAVQFEDRELERIWYHSQYFLACCLRSGKTAPGLFGNWSSGALGSSWHGDYHLDYNCQQLYWGVFSSNHVDQHLPYVELCENLLGMCEKYTRDKFQLPGACFPITAVPVPSQSIFLPAPPYAYQFSNTPWTVQSLWWHYLYLQDFEYLQRVYPVLRAAAQFISAYTKKGEDGRFHIVPTASPENWGCTVDFRLNKDCILDIALSQFLLDAVIEASGVLKTDERERKWWKEVREGLAGYPTANSNNGEVWLDVRDAPLETIYNVPVTLGPVFPAEQIGIGRRENQLDVARRTARMVRLEGGNDLVFQALIRARLGILNLDWFKREVRYCLLPNGVANDRVRQVGGRYDDSTDFDFMMRMGIWVENFSLPAVLNECMMQSYTGTIYLFPNTENLGPARFEDLRAAGAFLVSAARDGHEITGISILSEKGKTVRLARPWPSDPIRVIRPSDGKSVPIRMEGDILIFDTQPGERYQIESGS